VALSAAVSVTGALSAPSFGATKHAGSTAAAEVTFVQGMPNGPISVYADGALLIKYFVFKTTIGPVPLKAGTWSIAIRPTGASTTTRPELFENLLVTPGENASIVVNYSASAKPALSFFQNPTSGIAPGYARLAIRQLAAAPAINFFAGSARVGTNLKNSSQVLVNVPAGLHTIGAIFVGSPTSALTPSNFALSPGSTSILYVVGSAAPRSLALIRQTY
jgi:hypothetical protein